MNVTFAPYHDSMELGFLANASAIEDPPELVRRTLQAYTELKEAAGKQIVA